MKCDVFPADATWKAVKSHQAGLASCFYTNFCLLQKLQQAFVSVLLHPVCTAHLSEVDILRGREVEALLAALVLQQTLREPIRYFNVAAVVFLCVQGGVGQHGCSLLNVSRVQERRVTGKLVRLKRRNGKQPFSNMRMLRW